MAKYQKKTNYREKYPDISREIIEVLEKSDRQMEYLQYDIKVERCRINYATELLHISPAGRTPERLRRNRQLRPLARVWTMPRLRP